MRGSRSLFLSVALAVICLVLALTSPVGAAKGGKGKGKGGGGTGAKPTAVVALGDSYLSGESGRWEGNAANSLGDRDGTDRAAYKRWGIWFYDAERVYGATDNTGCHRSDTAPILSAGVGTDATFNLACSGAATRNVISAASGGVSHRGEAPQADQLAVVAATHDVQLVVLSIGGNDLGFADAIIDCTIRYNTSPTWWKNTCAGAQQGNVDAAMPAAMAGVAQAIADIRSTLAAAGDDDFRLVLVSYPSPVPRGAEIRYSESGWSRTTTGGCPFWNSDATWARDQLVPQISSNLASVASAAGVEFLDLSDAFEGREVCSVSTAQGDGGNAEWARFVSTGITQGEAQESMHPNALGQQAVGTCLSEMAGQSSGWYRCTNVPGAGPATMQLAQLVN